jgi:hypothetical protein
MDVPERLRLKSLREARGLEREVRREELFNFFVTNKMLKRFEDDLDELGLSTQRIDEIVQSAAKLSYSDLYCALSYPHDLRAAFLGKLIERMDAGTLATGKTLEEMASIARRNGFSIGFHLSKYDIKPHPRRGWAVIGTEQDHRDNDLPMAYYARTFKSLYRRKLANYMYIVRAEDDHRVSPDNKWWRAPSLSIVQQIPVEELRTEMMRLEEEMREMARAEGVPIDEEE